MTTPQPLSYYGSVVLCFLLLLLFSFSFEQKEYVCFGGPCMFDFELVAGVVFLRLLSLDECLHLAVLSVAHCPAVHPFIARTSISGGEGEGVDSLTSRRTDPLTRGYLGREVSFSLS